MSRRKADLGVKRLPMARMLLIGDSGDFGETPFFDSFGSSP
jgi:hypothetical protein